MSDLVHKFDPPADWFGAELPPEVAAHPLLQVDAFGVPRAWIELRDSGREPYEQSRLVSSHQSRAEFLVGAWVINEIVPRRISPDGLLGNLQPQMLRTADILGAGGPLDAENPRDDEGQFLNAVLEPRRSAKTTSIWCVTIGRCWMRPVYMAAYTMLTLAKKADERFSLDVRDTIKRKWKDPKTRPIKVLDGKGSKGLEFPNGSKLSVLAPTGDDVRSGGYDVLVLDEAGEAEPDIWDDIVGAVVPSFDTRPGAQLIYAGTGGKYRDGSHFWATLHDPGAGRIRYGVADDVSEALLASWESGAGDLIDGLHPGLDGLTNLATIRRNFPLLGAVRFSLEYLGHFGKALGNDTVIDTTGWGNTTERGEVPTGVEPQALAFAVHPGGLWASIAVAWYLPDDGGDLATAAWALDGDDTEATPPRIGFKLIHHQEGNANLDRKLWQYVKMLRLPIVYDGGAAQEKDVIQQINRVARPRPQTRALAFAEKSVAHTRLLNGITHATVAHWEQQPLDKAAAGATKRMAGKSVLFGTPADDPTFDITPLEAVAAAMYALPDPSAGESFGPIIIA